MERVVLRLCEIRRMVAEVLEASSHVSRPMWEAAMIVAASHNVSREAVLTSVEDRYEPSPSLEMARRRAKGEPLAYVLGSMDFLRWRFLVGPGCLIPRPETEVLALKAAEVLPRGGTFLDWGTGSGCIACSIAMMVQDSLGVAMDLSPGALKWAWRNLREHQLLGRVFALHGGGPLDLPSSFKSFDLVVANPPYIPSDHLAALDVSVRCFEPHVALDGGPRGLEVPLNWLSECGRILKPGGYVLMETAGPHQVEELGRLSLEGFEYLGCFEDQYGVGRFAWWRSLGYDGDVVGRLG
ncbi:MAG: peptide chain release factor N(5)-glutamine methyltransferase [Thermanaerothrix sp.]|nr:peptide chain release factor N(5)-glutamine methyltransferase [Thermanaerothrix sp.]